MNGNCFGDLCPSLDVAILLASLASQAEYGDLCEEELSDTEELTYLPRRILRLIPAQLWTQIQSTQGVTQKFREHYKSHKGMNRDKAELQYLKVAQMHNLFGVDFFPIVYARMKFPRTLSSTQNESTLWDNTNQCHTNAWLGVTAAGLQLYGKCQRDPPQFTFPWNMIKNVSYRERKFTIKLTSTCRGTNKPSQNTSVPTLLNETRGPAVISSKASQPNRSPLISITGQAFVGVAVGSSAGGSGTSAASLPSTPISARLIPSVPLVSPNLLDTSVNLSSPRAVSKFESCDTAQQLGASKGFKGRAKVLELGSRCIPGLSIKSSRYSANEFAVTRTSVNCLRGPRVQSAENNVSLPSKSLLKSSNLNSETVLISVVEVWLADPNQAKTVMSMCAGNHSLFMRRRQPDSIEVQQMRAQAREERARREVERARLAKARAEKAEALEAKSVLEARCAQLEEALIHQQKRQNPYTSDNHNRLIDTYVANSTSTHTSQCISTQYNCKVAFSPTRKENQKDDEMDGMHISRTLNDDDDDQKSISNPTVDNDKTTSDMNGDRCGNYFDDYSFYPPVTNLDGYPVHHGKSCDDGIQTDQNNLVYTDPLYPNIPANSFPVCSKYTDHRFAPGSVSVPVTPHVKRTEVILDRGADYYLQSSMWPFESTSCPVDLHSEHSVYKTHSNKKVVLYPSYLVTNLGPVYSDGTFCGIAIKSLLSGNHCLTGEIPVVSVGDSISKEPETSFSPFVIVPGSLPALHNDEVLNSKSRTRPTDVSHCNHNPCSCAVMSTEHQPPTVCHIHSPPQTIIREVSYTVPTNVLRHPQYCSPNCHVQFVPHDPVDRSQYMYSSPSLAAILSPIVTQRLHRRISHRPQPSRGLQRQQSQPKSPISSDSVHIPVIERSTSYMQIPYSENDCGLASTEEFNLTNKHFLSRPTDRGCSFQYPPCSTNVHSKYHDFQTGRKYPKEVYPNPLLYYQFHSPTTNEYLRRAASLDVSSGNNDLLWNIAPRELLSRTSERNEDENVYLFESNPPYSQRSFLTNQLQEERAHFAFLQTQFSRQLCDTWGYLKAARGQQADKLCDSAIHAIGSNIYNNPSSYGCELRCDPAGASDGASTGGGNICSMCSSSAYDGHDHLHDTSPDHHFYEPYSQLNQDISSPDDSGVNNLRLMISGGRSENKLEGNANALYQELQSSAQSRYTYMNLYTQSTKAF
ncbi:unnamed protein product [Schistosoma intercalatum]|nr:unnamed protein product [Schistosoma intercalatum]